MGLLWARDDRSKRRRWRIPCVLASCALGAILIAGLPSCSLTYSYPAPEPAAQREFRRLTQPGLLADPTQVPGTLPAGPLTIPLSFKHGRYFVSALVNGADADLMLDWGSWVNVGLMPYMVLKAKAALSDESLHTSTLDGAGWMRTGSVRELQIDGVLFRDIAFAMSNHDLTVKLGGLIPVYHGKGMLGLPILAGYERFAIDKVRNRLLLGILPDELTGGAGVVTLPFDVVQGVVITAMIDEVRYRLKVDVGGYSGNILLDGPSARAFMRKHEALPTGYATGFGDAVVEQFESRASVVRTGLYEVHDVPVELLPPDAASQPTASNPAADAELQPPECAGIVGDEFFGQTIVGVDWGKRELSFVPLRR